MTEITEVVHTYQDGTGDGAELDVTCYSDGDVIVQADTTVLLERGQVLDLYHRLGDHLVATGPVGKLDFPPDATVDGYAWPALPCETDCVATGDHRATGCVSPEPLADWERELLDGAPQGTVLDQAKAAVYGDREADYGHPREDFTRQAILYTGLLQHKLADGAYIEAEDIARLMIATKLARDVHSPKRDNRVDGAGYFLTLDRLATGK